MLNYMRQNAGSRFIKILLAAIAASFIIGFGFLPSLSRNGDRVSYAAMVNDETVSAEELQHAYRNLYNAFRDQFGEKFDPKQLEQFNLPQMALDQLVVRRLKLAEADRLGIQVSDEQVRAAIREIPAFQQGGRFNKDIYVRLLQYNRTSPSEFETAEREELKISLVEDLVRAGAQITPQEARAKYLEENDQIVLAYLEFSADAFEDQVSRPDDAALRAYLGTHADPFRTKRQVRVNYVSFPFSAFGPPPPTEDEVKARYEQDIAKYRNEEQVRARHILIKISDGDEAKARTLAESIVKRLRAGESFEKLAEKYSEDPGSKTRGGDLGFFPRGRMVPAFEEAAFALKVGEISEPIKSDFGFHVIRVEERKPGGTTPLAEVHDEIAKAIVRDRADAATRQAAEDFQKKASVGDAFTPPAGAVAGKTGFVTLGDDVEGIGRNYLFTSTASRMQANEVSKPIRVGEGYLVLRAEEVREPAVPPFEEITDKVAES
ncbi:MAG: SurA N-terminal domain-containing protein, partial [Myxococcales bacterium]|nr:SurA N-terminal domain-containing protein [Myxococcales bacterium]